MAGPEPTRTTALPIGVPTDRESGVILTQSTESEPIFLQDIRHLSPEQFVALGVPHVAYVKPVMMNGALAFAIHGADGTPMALADNEAVALAAIVQHEMTGSRVH